MKRLLTIVCMLNFMVVSTVSSAEIKQPVKKSGRALEGTVKTRIGKLKFINGYPSDSTIKKLYNELDFQRACQAYIWGLHMVEITEWHRASEYLSLERKWQFNQHSWTQVKAI